MWPSRRSERAAAATGEVEKAAAAAEAERGDALFEGGPVAAADALGSVAFCFSFNLGQFSASFVSICLRGTRKKGRGGKGRFRKRVEDNRERRFVGVAPPTEIATTTE